MKVMFDNNLSETIARRRLSCSLEEGHCASADFLLKLGLCLDFASNSEEPRHA